MNKFENSVPMRADAPKRKGYDDAAMGYSPLHENAEYLKGYHEGLLAKLEWANSDLNDFLLAYGEKL